MSAAHDCKHKCCDERTNPFHDHWLEPHECPSCSTVAGDALRREDPNTEDES